MAPRIPPKNVADLDPDTQELVTKTLTAPDGEVLNIFRTMSHHPWVTKRFLQFGTQLLVRGTLPARERELLILRTGWNTQSEYEWGQHVAIGRAVGLTDVELARVRPGPTPRAGAPPAPRCCGRPTSSMPAARSRARRGHTSTTPTPTNRRSSRS
jgi:alkylhydroperoxidase family enzyme